MEHGLGPYGIISIGEVAATLTVLTMALCAMLWMAYRNRHP
jgi:hypothetical protein